MPRDHITEPARDIPVVGKYDVIVIGGGIAGVAASLAAARNGSKVLLIERAFALGGLATLGLVVIYLPLCDGMGTQVCHGIAEELFYLSIQHGWEDRYPSAWLRGESEAERKHQRLEVQYNGQVFAILMEELLHREGIDLLYGTSVCAAEYDGNLVHGVFVENKSGRQFIEGQAFVDASGDADLCQFIKEDVAVNAAGNPLAAWYYETIDGEYRLRILGASDLERPGEETPAISPKRYIGLDAKELSDMVCDSHGQSLNDYLKRGTVSRGHALSTMASIPMIRMTRRIVGAYEMKESDAFKCFADSVGLVSDWRKCGPIFEVPFSALHTEKTKNLFVAGRCISAIGGMWDIMRVIPPCAVTGEASGTAASLFASFSDVDIGLLQKRLKKGGVKLHIGDLYRG